MQYLPTIDLTPQIRLLLAKRALRLQPGQWVRENGARGRDGRALAAQAEAVRDPVGDDAPVHPGEGVLGDRVDPALVGQGRVVVAVRADGGGSRSSATCQRCGAPFLGGTAITARAAVRRCRGRTGSPGS
jgi:hypothetical protein